MLFNSYTFFIFFAIVLLVSRRITSWNIRKSFLLICSYLFYAAWNPPFVLLLWFSTVVDYGIAAALAKNTHNTQRKFLLYLSLLANFGLLGFFKYGNFFLENFSFLLNGFVPVTSSNSLNIILPVGISFYTFQTLSYTLDVYNKKMPPSESLLDFALYVTFFPQLVAGPIVRAADFLPQCREPIKGSESQIGWGLCLFICGLFTKIVLADVFLSPVADLVYKFNAATDPPLGFLSAWTGTLAFAMQIFYDFYGYSTCAIGLALCLGFRLTINFNSPYAAQGFSDFWQRWHISLSTWLRDYLYIPLGGNRKGTGRTYMNLMLTMLLGGLWHGASWMFVIWGCLHGFYLIIERLLRTKKTDQSRSLFTKICYSLFTFFAVCIAWVFFRAENISSAVKILSAMFNFVRIKQIFQAIINPGVSLHEVESFWLGVSNYLMITLITLTTLLLHQLFQNKSPEMIFSKMHFTIKAVLLALMSFAILISMTGSDHAFIYFQF